MLSFSDWLKMTDLRQSRLIKILLLIIIHLFSACSAFQNVSDKRDLRQNYLKAVKDAEVAEPNEIIVYQSEYYSIAVITIKTLL
jgi:uncharacterized lipoprotein